MGLVDGSIDIVVGTHRMVSQDVKFHNLGLIVIDEEQRSPALLAPDAGLFEHLLQLYQQTLKHQLKQEQKLLLQNL